MPPCTRSGSAAEARLEHFPKNELGRSYGPKRHLKKRLIGFDWREEWGAVRAVRHFLTGGFLVELFRSLSLSLPEGVA